MSSANAATGRVGIAIIAVNGPGVLHQLSGVIAGRNGDITSVEITDRRPTESSLYFEVDLPEPPETLLAELRATPVVNSVERARG